MKRSSAEEKDLNEQNAKRDITHQITKNRGLTGGGRGGEKKIGDLHLGEKKNDRNPRVNREKFRRAKVRRRGEVHEVHRKSNGIMVNYLAFALELKK